MSDVILGMLLLIFVLFGAYLSVCLFQQRKLRTLCQKMGDELREMEKKLQELILLRRMFDAYEEPFVTSLLDIDAKLETLHNDLRTHFQKYIHYREFLTRVDNSLWWQVYTRWNALNFYRLQRNCNADMVINRTLDRELEQARARFDQIREFPWSIALQSREMMEYLRQAKLLVNELNTVGMHGEELNNLFNQINEVEEDSKQIPVYFLCDPYDKLISEASQEDVRQVYQIVQRDLLRIIECIQKSDLWKNHYLALKNQSEIAGKELERTVHLLSYFPEEIELTEEQLALDEWRKQLSILRERLENLAVEEITSLAREFSDFVYTIQSKQQNLRQNRQRWYQYQRVMRLNLDLISQIQKWLEIIAQSSLIVDWDTSGEQFHQALEVYNRLQSTEKSYSFHVLEKIYEESSQLQISLSNINRKIARAAEFHNACEKMLNSEEIKKLDQWIDSVRKLSEAIHPYDPRNWPNREWVLNFDQQLEELERNYRHLTEKLAHKPISENLLEELHHFVEEVYRQSVSFRERVNVIEQVFRNLVKSENHNLALLKTTRNQFAQITMFVLSQPLLAEKAEREIIQLDRRFDLCEAAFSQRDKDTLARKQTKLRQLISDVEHASNRWMSIVESDCLKLLSDLEKRLDRINSIGHFEDAVLFQAKEILARREEVVNFRTTARVNIPIDQLVGAMKKVFDTWQESYAVSKQLAEQVEAPLLSAYQEFQTLQHNVQAKYLALERLIPPQRKWPPNSLLLTVERNDIVQLEERWRNLHTQPTSIIQFVKTLSDMTGSYRTLFEKFKQYEQWGIQEQSRIERIEAEIYRLDRLWEIQQRRYGQIPEIESQIRELRQKANREIVSLRQYWLTNASRRPPSVDYDVVLRKLIELSRHLANAKVVLMNEQGQQELIDINGQVIQKT